MVERFGNGIKDGVVGYYTGLWNAVTHPVETIKSTFSVKGLTSSLIDTAGKAILGEVGYQALTQTVSLVGSFIEDGLYGAGHSYGTNLGDASFKGATLLAGAAMSKITSTLQQAGKISIKVPINKVLNNPNDPFTQGMSAPGVVSDYCRSIPSNGYGKISVTKLANGFYQLANGHHRVAALKSLGYDVIKIFITE